MADRSISIRLSLEDRDNIRRKLEELGNAGDAAAAKLAGAFSKVPPAAGQASTSVGRFGQVAQQAGYQIQDAFVQIQAGTSVLQALTQQGLQLAGAFNV